MAPKRLAGTSPVVREVWSQNLETELATIRNLIDWFPVVFLSMEHPGVVARPIGAFKSTLEYHYQTVRVNADILRIVRLGLTFSDQDGNVPQDCSTWQFNFKFSREIDMIHQTQADTLIKSGVDFQKHEEWGIDVEQFGELLISSGLILLDEVRWVAHHALYDFAYLLKSMTLKPLPIFETEFMELCSLFFPKMWDVLTIYQSLLPTQSSKTGVQFIWDDLQMPRWQIPPSSSMTSFAIYQLFFELKLRLNGQVNDDKFNGNIWGLNVRYPQPQAKIPQSSKGSSAVANNKPSQFNFGNLGGV
ncbi:Poly(A) ribonuclease pop2 [Neolecta irregularis DAH-3]|uniref:poly(A)-specific ribonuclease n=1 Tax=Neolecta irregularis (strain DAH-3) TaxID=1198029 RepID=A0A1U7LWC2_NEOID|nr:Poly(A) ribonuclease pop2 [Neolecta irregularis DAH-3]|eukprot:OLL26934.1 Poly(A) ribonuclease pop2 [Neolecta irregularis DAH-3]